jgi:hypothetical protein
VYPFAGHECARALALMSTEVSDCNDKVDDLGYTERETLRDWTVSWPGEGGREGGGRGRRGDRVREGHRGLERPAMG